ncbi:hypothetical protein FRC09_006200 [Ceratobasidium sp. 395]|nr:hypothetical protein FRC09_006200 [Ceratobasidium sp. 395]
MDHVVAFSTWPPASRFNKTPTVPDKLVNLLQHARHTSILSVDNLSCPHIKSKMSNMNDQGNTKLSKNQRRKKNKAAREAAAAAGGFAPNNLPLRPSAFANLPANIIAQIVPHLYPEDVIYLAQVNKSIRKLLMSRSASAMWRACIENNGLPSCPSGLSEPKYVSLLFRSICSSCGEPTSIWTRSGLLRKCQKRDVEIATVRFIELQSSGDVGALEAWIQTQKGELKQREKSAQLLDGLRGIVCKNRTNELKREWRKHVERALLNLGYQFIKDEDLPDQKRYKWKKIMERPVAWTESNWDRYRQQIIQFVQNDEKDRPIREQKARRSARNDKIRDLLDCMGRTISPPLDGSPALSKSQMAESMAKRLPLPTFADTLEWPVIKSLIEEDVPMEQMIGQFENHKGEITRLVTEWGERAKQELANVLKEESHDSLVGPSLAATNSKAPSIARMLLSAMGHPEDAAPIEFYGEWFACGRCGGPRRSWSSLVAHYVKQVDDWEYVQKELPELTESDVIYNNIHDPAFSTTPLVKHLSLEEAKTWEAKAWETAEDPGNPDVDEEWGDYRFACRLCMAAQIESPMSLKVKNMFPHVTDVHGISDLENGDVDEPFDWVSESPYICVLEEMCGMGWCLAPE